MDDPVERVVGHINLFAGQVHQLLLGALKKLHWLGLRARHAVPLRFRKGNWFFAPNNTSVKCQHSTNVPQAFPVGSASEVIGIQRYWTPLDLAHSCPALHVCQEVACDIYEPSSDVTVACVFPKTDETCKSLPQ